jgi:hypothetical protein
LLKGKAIIELTDVNSGKIETYTEENMVTNAITDILNFNPGSLHLSGVSMR